MSALDHFRTLGKQTAASQEQHRKAEEEALRKRQLEECRGKIESALRQIGVFGEGAWEEDTAIYLLEGIRISYCDWHYPGWGKDVFVLSKHDRKEVIPAYRLTAERFGHAIVLLEL